MRILIDASHPAHVHFYKNTIKCLEKKGHEVLVTARNKEVTTSLLDAYDINHIVLTSMKGGKSNLLKEWLIRDYKLHKVAKKFNPDILTGILNPSIAHVSWLLGKKSIIFNDTEQASFAQNITYPFSSIICTPSCFNKQVGKKQVMYNGYHELAYLHPDYFTPNPGVLHEIGLKESDKLIILRFVSWGASHDVRQHGISDKIEFVKELEKYGRVIITSEGALEPELDEYKLNVSPDKMHDLLYYASLFVGESPTMTTESAILGTPAICISSWACKCGNFKDLSSKYNLIYCYRDEKRALSKAISLLNSNSKEKWSEYSKKLLADKINVTAFMVEFIENLSYST